MEFRPIALDLRTFAQGLVDEVLAVNAQRCPIELLVAGAQDKIQADERLLNHIFTNRLTSQGLCP